MYQNESKILDKGKRKKKGEAHCQPIPVREGRGGSLKRMRCIARSEVIEEQRTLRAVWRE